MKAYIGSGKFTVKIALGVTLSYDRTSQLISLERNGILLESGIAREDMPLSAFLRLADNARARFN